MNKKYVVYEHVTPDGMYYFGQTQNVEKRWSNNGAGYKRTALQPYIEKFGWENIQHIILFENQSKENALFIEDFLIETAREDGVCINKQRSGLVSKKEGYRQEYYETNKGQILEQQQQYYEQNKEQILEQQQQYREQNKDKIKEQKKQHYEQNKDKIKEQKKQHYEQNKDKIKEQKKQHYEQNKDKIKEQSKQYYEQNKDKINERRRQRYQRKKEEQQLKELGILPLW